MSQKSVVYFNFFNFFLMRILNLILILFGNCCIFESVFELYFLFHLADEFFFDHQVQTVLDSFNKIWIKFTCIVFTVYMEERSN